MSELHVSGQTTKSRSVYRLRTVEPRDFQQIIDLTQKTYPFVEPYDETQLASQHEIFAAGQLVVEHRKQKRIVGYAASLIVDWDDYPPNADWGDMTDWAMFTNHDPEKGKTLYGAEVMVDPSTRGQGVGKLLYEGRENLCRSLHLARIRAGARIRDYHKYAKRMSPDEYVCKVVEGKLKDRTLSFQLNRGFHVLFVAKGYLFADPESLGFAAVIEWINEADAIPEDYEGYKLSRYYEAHKRRDTADKPAGTGELRDAQVAPT